MEWFKKRYYREAGYKDLFKVATPLLISNASLSLLMFVDRMFASWYSSDALAAAMPAGIFAFGLSSLFLGTTTYVGTFVSQYFGANRPERIGPALWQGLYLSIFSGTAILIFFPLAPFLFKSFGHDPAVTALEISYFRLLILGSFPLVGMAVFSGFYSGRSITRPVMWIHLYMLLLNTPLNYILVFGWKRIPEMGLSGAGISTLISQYTAFALFGYIVFRKKNNSHFATLSGWRFDPVIFTRLIRFGFPSGIHMFIEIMGFNIFILMIGRLGKDIQAASNIAFQIDIFGFIIVQSIGIAVSIKVGQYIGSRRISNAVTATMSGLQISLSMSLILALIYIFMPETIVSLFGVRADSGEFEFISRLAVQLLLFVAAYSFFDSVQLIFSSAIKGAGDTVFVMKYLGLLTVTVMIIPSVLIVNYLGGNVYWMWSLLTFFVFALASVYTFRFLGGKWKNMQVIEKVPEL